MVDNKTKRYIREGVNQNAGADQTDIFVVGTDGRVDQSAPIIWDYDRITSATVYPIDTEVLTVSGGTFTTRANQEEMALANNTYSSTQYYARGIQITRSNTVVENVRHLITDEPDQPQAYQLPGTSKPYTGFLQTTNCAYVTIRDCELTGHKAYTWNKNTGGTTQGTYDFNANSTIGLTIENCTQTNDITDGGYWGIFTSNYSKDITLDGVEWSRFDAHQGVYNATVKNSVLGHQGMQIIGGGTMTVENTTIYSNRLIWLRSDYGSTWEGDIVIKNCTLNGGATVIDGSNSGNHNFGYPCCLPSSLTVDGLTFSSGGSVNIFSSGWGSDGAPYAIRTPDTVRVRGLKRSNGAAVTNFTVTGSSRFSGLTPVTSW